LALPASIQRHFPPRGSRHQVLWQAAAGTIRSVNFASLRSIKNVFPDATGRFNHDLTRMSDLVSRLSFDAQHFVAGRYAKEFRNYNARYPLATSKEVAKKKAAVSSRRA
jgi:hypothetical protein